MPKKKDKPEQLLQQIIKLLQAGDIIQADKRCKEIIEHFPMEAEAWHLMGYIALQKGDYPTSEKHLKKAIALSPENCLYHENLGVVWQLQSKLHDAVSAFKKVLSINTTQLKSMINLANCYLQLKDNSNALFYFQQVLKYQPDHRDVLYKLGLISQSMGQYEQAGDYLKQSLKSKTGTEPQSAMIIHALGNVYYDMQDYSRAIDYYQKTLSRVPDNPQTLNNMGNALKALKQYDKAIRYFKKAIKKSQRFSDAYHNLGNTLVDMHHEEQAIDYFQQAVESDPANAKAYNHMANTLMHLGRLDEAYQAYQQAVTIDPLLTDAYYQAFRLKGQQDKLIDIQGLLELDKNNTLADDQKMFISYALAIAYEKNSEFVSAFSHLQRANKLKRVTYDYHIEKDIRLFDSLKTVFSEHFFQNNKLNSSSSKSPVFILGMPRSGTTLVEQILSSHPQVFGAGELSFLSDIANQTCEQNYKQDFPRCVPKLKNNNLAEMAKNYLKATGNLSDKPHIVDKMPHNFLFIGLIKLLFPNAKVIHCRRDPVENCFSIFKVLFGKDHPYAYDLVETAQYYNAYLELMAHWKNIMPDFIYDIHYENVVNNTQQEIKQLLQFCELDWNDACLSFYQSPRKVKTASAAQVRQPIYKSSLHSWQHYKKQLEPLLNVLQGVSIDKTGLTSETFSI